MTRGPDVDLMGVVTDSPTDWSLIMARHRLPERNANGFILVPGNMGMIEVSSNGKGKRARAFVFERAANDYDGHGSGTIRMFNMPCTTH